MNENIRALVKEALEKGYLMSLGTHDGAPWVADVIYVFDDDLNIYWMSDPDVRHSQAIAKDPNVAGAITPSGKGEDNLGIQFQGIAEKIDGPRHDLAVKHFAKRDKPAPTEDEDVLQGDSWYVLRPKKIDVNCECLFGFDKRYLEL